MIVLKSVIRYPDTNSVEATWVDQETTAATTDANGDAVPAVVTETQVRCHSYDQTQMAMLTSDLGADAATYANLIAQVSANLIVPPAPTLAQAQAAQTLLVNNSAQGALAAMVSAYPALEVSTWPQQVAEATAVTANPAAATPTLTAAATASGQTVAALAANVLAKSAAYTSAAGAIVGKRIALSNQIVEATTVAAVLAINW